MRARRRPLPAQELVERDAVQLRAPGEPGTDAQAAEPRAGAEPARLRWLGDEHIGELPNSWNWLVGVQPRPADVQLAHYTLGMPFMAGYERAEYSDLWWAEFARMRDCPE